MGRFKFAGHPLRAKNLIMAVLLLLTMTCIGSAETESKSTTEEILEILKDRGMVTDTQYEELMKKAEAEKKKTEKEYAVKWSNGINFDRNDGAFKVKIGGRIHFDWGVIGPDSSLERNEANGVYKDPLTGDGVEFRRARLYASGTLWKDYLFKAQYDFAGGDADFKDVYLGMKNIPVVGTLLVGQMHEPFSLEELTSSNYITFMERSLPTGAFAPSRKTGIRASNAVLDKGMTWALGIFYGDSDDYGDSDFDNTRDLDLTLRLTGLPYYKNKGKQLLHLGLGYSRQFRDEGKTTVRYRNRPESHLTDVRLVDTGDIDLDNADLLNPEVAFVWGPLSFQGEYFWTRLDSSGANDPAFQGAYAYGSWFMTGENRPYSTSSGKFSRVKPTNNFHPTSKGGPGAWEFGVRWSWIDLNDEQIRGGKENNITVGVNWYLNPNYRVMFNYIYADVEDRSGAEDGKANIFQTRFQVDF
jgi:phosphate-selective porin OprO/OprP